MLKSRGRVVILMLLLALPAPAVAQGAQSGGLPTGAPAPNAASKAAAPAVWGDLYPAFPGDIAVAPARRHGLPGRSSPTPRSAATSSSTATRSPSGADGWWCYATGRDGDGALADVGRRAGIDAAPAGLPLGVGRHRSIWEDADGGDIRTAGAAPAADRLRARRAEQAAAEAGEPGVFRFPVLMLATWWDEEAGQTEPQFQEGNTAETFTRAARRLRRQPHRHADRVLLREQLRPVPRRGRRVRPVHVAAQSRQDRCYYGGIDPGDDGGDDLDLVDDVLGIGGGGAIGMAVEAVPQADPDVDFSQYDNDGDGFVDFTGILHSGPDMAATGDPCHTWSHAIRPASPADRRGRSACRARCATASRRPTACSSTGSSRCPRSTSRSASPPTRWPTPSASPTTTTRATPRWAPATGTSWPAARGSGTRPARTRRTSTRPAACSRAGSRRRSSTTTRDDVDAAAARAARRRRLHGRPAEPEPRPGADEVDRGRRRPTRTGHEWTEDDVYGLVQDGDRGYVDRGLLPREHQPRRSTPPPIHARDDAGAVLRPPGARRRASWSGTSTTCGARTSTTAPTTPGPTRTGRRWTRWSWTATTTPRSSSSA